MIISISDAVRQTTIVGTVLLLLIISARRTKQWVFFSLDTTAELKGIAILMVVLSHIGYFLVDDHRFLVPWSNYAGVGVDLFLLLSGYGLVVSALQRPLSIGKFYLKRLVRVYVPVLLTVALFLLLDFFWLYHTYPTKTIIESLLAFFPNADIYNDLNSPLWYITPLLFYYVIFPIIFWRRFPWLSAIVMAIIGWYGVRFVSGSTIFAEVVYKLYRLHFVAFPVGMALGVLLNQPPVFINKFTIWLKVRMQTYRVTWLVRWAMVVLGGGAFVYFYYHPMAGDSWKKEVVMSLVLAVSTLVIFLCKKINFSLLRLFGLFSFEIYLLHWPLLYRYNFLYGRVSAGLATIIYLALFLGVGYGYRQLISRIFHFSSKNSSAPTSS